MIPVLAEVAKNIKSATAPAPNGISMSENETEKQPEKKDLTSLTDYTSGKASPAEPSSMEAFPGVSLDAPTESEPQLFAPLETPFEMPDLGSHDEAQETQPPPAVFEQPNSDQSFIAEVRAQPSVASQAIAAIAAAIDPLSVKITGKLENRFRERLIELLNLENFGLREIDLEPQFEAGKILLPRISEYAAVLVVRCLKDAPVLIEVFKSDQESGMTEEKGRLSTTLSISSSPDSDLTQDLPSVTTAATHPLLPLALPFDVLTTSALVELSSQDPENGPQFSVVLARLKLELQYRARLKGAQGLVLFKHRLTQLGNATEYLLEAEATLVKNP